MRLFTIVAAFLMLLMFASCEKSLDETVSIDKVEAIERAFYFTPDFKDGQTDQAYTISADLNNISNEGEFLAKWGNDQEYYSFEFVPGESEARLMKFFGNECIEVASIDKIERSSALKFEAIEDDKGAISISLGGEVLFENIAEGFQPKIGKYIGKGGLIVSNFNLQQ